MSIININKFDYDSNTYILDPACKFGICSTPSGTATKTVSSLSGGTFGTFVLEDRMKIAVKFTNKNTAASPTLNICSTGAKPICINNAALTAANAELLYGVIEFMYDATSGNQKWEIIGNYINTDTKVSTAAVATNATTTYYPTVGTDTTSAATKYYDKTGLKYTVTNGTTSAVGSSVLALGNSTSSGTANNKEGQLVLYGSKSYATTLKAGDTYGARTITFPDNSGTVALAEDYLETEWIPFDDMFIDPVYNGIVREGAVATFVQRCLNYVTPQMFGAVADGVEDDTYAIQCALDYSLNVFFPEGTYIVSAPLYVRNHARISGMSSKSLIRVSNTAKKDKNDDYFTVNFHNNNFTHDNEDLQNFIRTAPSVGKFVFVVIDGVLSRACGLTESNHSNVHIEHIKIDCNDLYYCGGIRLMCPYNDSSIRNVLIDNVAYIGLYVGDETSQSDMATYVGHPVCPKPDDVWEAYTDSNFIKAVRSQTLVVDNCYFEGSDTEQQRGALAYFYNSLEVNLKDTKFLFKSANPWNQPCVIFNMGTDAYVRGCSFAHTLGEAVRFTGYTKYFRLMGNTYEDIGTSSDLTNSNNVTVRDYAISCFGSSTQKIQGGLIIETMYQNVPRKVYLDYTTDITIIGSFSNILDSGASTQTHTGDFLLNTLKGGIISEHFNVGGANGNLMMGTNGASFTLKDSDGTQYYLKAENDGRIHVRSYPTGSSSTHAVVASTADVNALKPTTKTYIIATATNSQAAPYGAVNATDYDISSDISSYGTPCSIVTTAPTASNCSTACLIGTNKLRVYSRTAASVTVRITYWKSSQITSV